MIVRTHQSEMRRRRFAEPVSEREAKPAAYGKTWVSDEVRILDQRRGEGWTYAAIAKQLGRTRNSLIGFDWRRRQR